MLLQTAQRHDPNLMDSTRLQISAFEAINDMVRAASPDTLDTVGQLTPVFLQEIMKTFNMQVSSGEQREKQAELQGQLCGVLQVRAGSSVSAYLPVVAAPACCVQPCAGRVLQLLASRRHPSRCLLNQQLPVSCFLCIALGSHRLQVIMQKLSEVEQYKAAVLQYADQIMETLLRVFQNRSTSVHEEAMLAVGAFTYACGRQFSKYLPAFYPFLKMGLMNHQEWQVRQLGALLSPLDTGLAAVSRLWRCLTGSQGRDQVLRLLLSTPLQDLLVLVNQHCW